MKVSSHYPPHVNRALQEILPEVEFGENATLQLPQLIPPFKIGELADYIIVHSGNNVNIGVMVLDCSKNTISLREKKLALTEKEAALLKYLAKAKTPASREVLLKDIWGYSGDADSKTVENHIYRLRQKLATSFGNEIIVTFKNGYLLP